ncbi:hypothetical protein BC831DRAFT_497609 [Entophlyctis helioformis]|nr:hypothetical protein BC831DRAFT_497609 [Entophlyctis helioformis]
MSHTNTQVLFKADPGAALVTTDHMEVVKTPFTIPTDLPAGTLVVKNLFLSLDPYMRGRMNTTAKSYSAPFTIGKPMQGGGVAQVIAGSRGDITVGDTVSTFIGFESFSVLPAQLPAQKLDTSAPLPLSYYLGIAGMPGATAYYGLIDLCTPKAGETVFVSGAAGAVGLVVGQIAKIKGLRVIGSAGSDDKVALLKNEFGFDEAFNYKTVSSVAAALGAAAPKGIDIYFDNVGGEHLEAALTHMNTHGRIAACGMISQYNGESYHIKNLVSIIGKQIKIQGLLIGQQLASPEFMKRFATDIKTWVHIVEGIENAPEAFVGLFSGINTGKLIIKL